MSAPKDSAGHDDDTDQSLPATVAPHRVAGRAHLRPVERRAGSVDPAEQARMILEDAERRRIEAIEHPHTSGERRTSAQAAGVPATSRPVTASPGSAPPAEQASHRQGVSVLVGVDDSKESRRAVDTAYRLFGPASDYTIVSVGQHLPMFTAVYPTGSHGAAAELNRLFATAEDAARSAAETVAERLDAERVTADVKVGPIASSLVEAAEEHGCEIIVIGSRDRSLWQRLLDPSVGHSLVECTDRPILIVPTAD